MYTKLGWQRMKWVYEFREDEGWTIVNLVTSAIRARYALMIKGSPE